MVDLISAFIGWLRDGNVVVTYIGGASSIDGDGSGGSGVVAFSSTGRYVMYSMGVD